MVSECRPLIILSLWTPGEKRIGNLFYYILLENFPPKGYVTFEKSTTSEPLHISAKYTTTTGLIIFFILENDVRNNYETA